MRDPQFNKISLEEKQVKNKYTQKGEWALIEVTDSNAFPDAKIAGKQMLYANVVYICDSEAEILNMVGKSKGRFQAIQSKKLIPQDIPYKLRKKLEKIEKGVDYEE